MSELKEILKQEYKKKNNTVSPEMLLRMVEEVMSLSIGHPLREQEKPKVRTYNISEIPMIPISELGWANADDNVESDDPDAPPEAGS